MKVVLVQSGQLGVLQRQRIACAGVDDNVVPALCRMGQNVREIVEDTFAELHNVMTKSGCPEIGDDVLAEIRREHERVVATVSFEQIVTRRAFQRVAAV